MCVCVCVFVGYMCSPSVLDKDGVSAAAIAGEMISYLATKNKRLSQQLSAIYRESDTNSEFTLPQTAAADFLDYLSFFCQVRLPHQQEFLFPLPRPGSHPQLV